MKKNKNRYHIKPLEAEAFTKFLLPMLHYSPYKRISAQNCLKSAWLTMPNNENYKMSEREVEIYF